METRNRLDAFAALAMDAWYRKLYLRLTDEEQLLCLSFIQNNDGLDREAFELLVNRMWLALPVKPRNWAIVSELLTVANINGCKPQERRK